MNKINKKYETLIEKAKSLTQVIKLTDECVVGEVGCALISDKGNIYTGVNIDCGCGIGFCAEHSAIASMITNKESKIKTIVAVSEDGKILPPCGRCRELMYQINRDNINTEIIIEENKVVKLGDLLPSPWQDRL